MDAQSTATQEPTLQSEAQSPSIQQQPESNHKKLFIIFGILALLVVIGSLYFMIAKNNKVTPVADTSTSQPRTQPTTDEFAGWKTYTDAEATMSFMYPPDWHIVQSSNNSTINLTNDTNANKIQFTITVKPFSIPNGKDLKEFIDSDGLGDLTKGYIPNPYSLSVVNKHSSYTVFQPSDWLSAQGIIVDFIQDTNKTNHVYTSLEPYNAVKGTIPEEDKYEKIYFSILSTFKFTYSNHPDNTNWKTYTNPKYNYSIKYPNNFELSQTDLRTSPDSAIFNKLPLFDAPGFPALYISVFLDGNAAGSASYNNMTDEVINSFYTMNVGEPKQISTESEFSIFKKLEDTIVAGQKGIVVENSKVWEGGDGLIDRRVFTKKNGHIYMIGTYYQSPQELSNFQNSLSTFKLSN